MYISLISLLLLFPCVDGGSGKNFRWSAWGSWTDCSSSCGVGKQERTRVCVNNGGQEVKPDKCGRSDAATEARRCTKASCISTNTIPVIAPTSSSSQLYLQSSIRSGKNFRWSAWGSWTDCTPSCGVGKQERTRVCVNNGGQEVKPDKCGKSDAATEARRCTKASCISTNTIPVIAPSSPSSHLYLQSSIRSVLRPTSHTSQVILQSTLEQSVIQPTSPFSHILLQSVIKPTSPSSQVLVQSPIQSDAGSDVDVAKTITASPSSQVLMQSTTASGSPGGSWTQWSEWSHCPVTCGSGIVHRYRSCMDNQRRNASSCEGKSIKSKACVMPDCDRTRGYFQIDDGHSLRERLLHRYLVFDSMECAVLCLQNSRCLSFNCQHKQQTKNAKVICELNNGTKQEMFFIENSRFSYHELVPGIK